MPFYIGPQKWWIDKQNQSNIVTNGLVLNLDAGNLASYNPNSGGETYLLLHADGANNSTNFIDSGSFGHTITRTGNAKISTVKSKFGGSSFRADGASTLTFPKVQLTGDFTIGLWVNFDDITVDQALLGCVTCQNSQLFRFNADGVSRGLMSYSNGGHIFFPTLNEISFMQSNQWYYLTMTRSGNIIRTFIDGQLLQTNNDYSAMVDLDTIGAGYQGNFNPFTGYIDDVVILDGTCLYTNSFTPPVAPYPNPGDSTTWYDLSGNGNNGTLVNGVSYDSSNQGSLVFQDNYVSLPDSFAFSTNPFSIETWVNGDSWGQAYNGNNLIFASQSYNDIGFYGMGFSYDVNGFLLSDYDGSTRVISVNNITPNPNQWYHIVAVKNDANEYVVYVNKEPSINNPTSTLSLTSLQPVIGTNPAAPENFYGKLSVFRIYNRALTDQEITQNYNALKGRYGL